MSKGVADSRSVAEIVRNSDIVVFSGDYCPYCRSAINAIKSEGYGDRMSVVIANSSQREYLVSNTNMMSIPNIWVKGKFIGGCNDGPESWMGLTTLINNGELKRMLNA